MTIRSLILILVLLVGGLAARSWFSWKPVDRPTPPPTAAAEDKDTVAPPSSADLSARPTIHIDRRWPAHGPGADLRLQSVSAADRDEAMVGGQVQLADGRRHSALFHTTDGGQHWQSCGPAIPDLAIVGIDLSTPQVRAIASDDHGLLHLLTSDQQLDAPWRQQVIRATGLPTGPVLEIMQGWLDTDRAVVHLRLAAEPATWYQLQTRDGGEHWNLAHAVDGGMPLADAVTGYRPTNHTPDGWGWRLNDRTIERRRPATDTWLATGGQPTDAYDDSTDVWFVDLPSQRFFW